MKTSEYQEFRLCDFLRAYPEYVSLMPSGLDYRDKNYVIRINMRTGFAEFGYIDDTWYVHK